ncbi:TRAP transporter, DctM subunit [Celeribacter baekdonensis]|uniref:TRAP transporter large permease protein n=1 Tax=Celeribacter baekdonensis TaxID=875171 RepID=A0A1G7PHN0_9RHOB|nr:TRAP transporter large permease [Celeribacter baekdonensis]SDF85882.1 TRAP transporter, DctM subunit [Celeribacter baekdonensis]
MSRFEIGLWSFPILLVLIFLRIPIGVAMFAVGFGGAYLLSGNSVMMLSQFKHLIYGEFSSYSFSIIPLFLLMGHFATMGGMSAGLFKAAETWLGHRKGGVAMAAVGACAGFGAICGSSLATAATMGKVALPELKTYGYTGRLATGALAAGGTLGILIPPSVILVVYAMLAEQNIAKLFVAAFIPGLLAALGYMICISIYVRIRPQSCGQRDKAPMAERLTALVAVWPVLTIFVAVVGGIYLGIFTPTEAAAVGAAGTGIVALASGGLTWRGTGEAILETAASTGMIFLILIGAKVFNNFLALSGVPMQAAAWVGTLGLTPWVILAAVLLLYLAFGCVMDSLSMIILTIPILFPILEGLDFGLPHGEFGLWFGIVVLIVVEVGLITPPVGMNLFIINALDKDTPISETFKGTLPFVITDLIRVGILIAFPALTLGLVRWIY